MEDIKDSLMWLGALDFVSLIGAALYLLVTKSLIVLTIWAWFNLGILSLFSLVALTFAIISAIVGIKKITKKGE